TGLALALTLTRAALAVEAQQAGKLPRIGVLFLGSSSTPAIHAEIVRQELRKLGYIEGQTITLEIRFANGHLDQVRGQATELVGARVEVIPTAGTAVREVEAFFGRAVARSRPRWSLTGHWGGRRPRAQEAAALCGQPRRGIAGPVAGSPRWRS